MVEMIPEQLRPFMPWIVNIALALVIFIVGWIVSKWAHSLSLRVCRKRSVDEALARFLATIVRYAVLAATLITALGKVGIETTSLVALLGVAGLAIGMALQGSLGNFAAGVMILLFRPFELGDVVTGGGHTGKVEDIGLFATILVTPAKEKIIIPNSHITGGSIVNLTTLETRRGAVSIGVAYGTKISAAMEVMKIAAQRSDLVLANPEPAVAFVGFGASSLDFEVRPWANSHDWPAMLHNVRIALYDDLNAAGIDIPFDQIVVHQA